MISDAEVCIHKMNNNNSINQPCSIQPSAIYTSRTYNENCIKNLSTLQKTLHLKCNTIEYTSLSLFDKKAIMDVKEEQSGFIFVILLPLRRFALESEAVSSPEELSPA